MAVNPIFAKINKIEINKVDNNAGNKSLVNKTGIKTNECSISNVNVNSKLNQEYHKNQHSKIKNIMDFNDFKKDFKFKLSSNKIKNKEVASINHIKNNNSLNFNLSNLTNTSKNKNRVDLSNLKKITEEYIDIVDVNCDNHKLLSDSQPKTTTSKINKDKFLNSLYGINQNLIENKVHHSKKDSNGKNDSNIYNNSIVINKQSKESEENFNEKKSKDLNNFTSFKLHEIISSLDEIVNYPTNTNEDISSVIEVIQNKLNNLKELKLLYTLRLENGKRSSTYKNSELSNKECTSIKSEYKKSDTFQELEFSKFTVENNFLSKSMNLSNLSKSDSKKKCRKPIIPCLSNLDDLPKNSFNQELLQHYDDFSPSWRDDVDKIKLS